MSARRRSGAPRTGTSDSVGVESDSRLSLQLTAPSRFGILREETNRAGINANRRLYSRPPGLPLQVSSYSRRPSCGSPTTGSLRSAQPSDSDPDQTSASLLAGPTAWTHATCDVTAKPRPPKSALDASFFEIIKQNGGRPSCQCQYSSAACAPHAHGTTNKGVWHQAARGQRRYREYQYLHDLP
jgi:hypothetical protein